MITAAEKILQEGISSLSSVYRTAFSHLMYQPTQAKRRLLQMPVAALRLGEPSSGLAEVQLMEYIPGIDYLKILHFLRGSPTKRGGCTPSISKQELKHLLGLAQSDKERECIRYAVYKASGLSATQARKRFGFENMSERSDRVEEALMEAQSIRECVESLSNTQEQAMLKSFGIHVSDTGSEECSECSDPESESAAVPSISTPFTSLPSDQELFHILEESQFNWFEFLSRVSEEYKCDPEEDQQLVSALENTYPKLLVQSTLGGRKELLTQSHEAFVADNLLRKLRDEREAAAFNGEIVSDIECEEDPEVYVGLDNLHSERAVEIITKRRKAIHRRARYLKLKKMAEQNFLSRKTSSTVRGILRKHPDIGKEIEDFVQQRNIGADHWRRTGVLTFDGNTRVNEKVTYQRIREHLQATYKRHFSYGTVVQLCVPRNRRRRSSKRYKGVARVTSRRARKGFQLKYNPDAHWSSALYRGLSHLQYQDGFRIININRDDASGFRLDTMTTHRLHKTPAVQGKDSLTTYTDYVNRYPSLLHVTCYNFTGTANTGELCAGMVKASGVTPKNPAQHACDIEMLEHTSEIGPAFVDPITSQRKPIECVRVDGAADEGPSHEEVQFFWTVRHLEKGYAATLISARNSGASYLNRVELQNGCLALGHANLFIPSTLSGSNIDPKTGKLDKQQFTRNMELATDVYINRVNHCPCGETVIELFRGADSCDKQKMRESLLVFLKGSKVDRERLKTEQNELYDYFQKIWDLRSRHLVHKLPMQYLFFLVCCFQQGCCHPVCRAHENGEPVNLPNWFEGGPSVSYLQIPDPNRPWGSSDCLDCNGGTCAGHYLKPVEALQSSLPPMMQPPSVILKVEFAKLKGASPSAAFVEEVAKKVLLLPAEVSMWFEHLKTISENRKRGATKAAETRRKRKANQKSQTECSCGVCHGPYLQFTDEIEQWIACERCESWFHFACVGVVTEPEVFICEHCLD